MNSVFSCIPFQTINGNIYMLSQKMNQIFLIHPIIYFFYKNDIEEGLDFFLNDIDIPFTLDNKEYSLDEVEYYYKKYIFFKSNGFFLPQNKCGYYKITITPSDILKSISNVDQIALELIQDCNLKCSYCIYGEFYKDQFRHNVMTFDRIKIIIDQLVPYWRSNLKVDREIKINYYGGEPLLKFDLIKQTTDYIKSLNLGGIRFTFGITTNATLLDNNKAKYLIDNDFVLAISIDGDKKGNSYRIYKGTKKEIFDDLINNIERIRSINEDYFYKNVHFLSVLHDKNSVSSLSDFFSQKYDRVSYQYGVLNNIGVIENKRNKFEKMYRPLQGKYNFKLKGQEFNFIKEREKILENFSLLSSYSKEETPYPYRQYTGTCFPFQKKIFITADYHIMPCEKISFSNNYGNIFSCNSFKLPISNIVRKHNHIMNNVINSCRACYYNDLCSLCVYTFMNDCFKKCKYQMNKVTMTKYLSSVFYNLENNISVQ